MKLSEVEDDSGCKEWLGRFATINLSAILVYKDGIDHLDALKIAYLRTIGMREGVLDYSLSHEHHNCRFPNFASEDELEVKHDIDLETMPMEALKKWSDDNRTKFTDMICTVAYFFRVRGHHWVEDMEDRYRAIWRKCLYNEDNPGLEWKFIAHEAFHGVYPDQLDKFWQDSVDDNRCSGALKKRFNSAPAGVAGMIALRTGVNDLSIVVPKALKLVQDAVDHLEQLESIINSHRWAGSINRNLYGAPKVVAEENRLGALGALIVASLRSVAPQAPLLRSESLKRIANNSPLTGSAVASMINTAVNHERSGLALLPDVT
jgi:hypothetical protein